MILTNFFNLEKVLFLKRYKRFLADVQMPNGLVETVHCANSGSMKSCQDPLVTAYLSQSSNAKRKLKYTLELLELSDGLTCVNTQQANVFVDHLLKATIAQSPLEPLQQAHFPYGFFKSYDLLKREALFLPQTRFDFKLSCSKTNRICWIEVKSVSLRLEEGVWAFPDAVTERGQKHLEHLMRAVEQGDEAWLFFVLMRGSLVAPHVLSQGFRIAHEIDPLYAALFEKAKLKGVRVALLIPSISLEGFGLREFKILS